MDIHTKEDLGIPTVISLFSGCGGSSLGYMMAGFREVLAIDLDKNSVNTFRLNFPDIPIWERDISGISGKEILKFCNMGLYDLDVLDGSPPCQGFSITGKREISDPRNDLVMHYVRLINTLKPKVFVMENVGGMVIGKMKSLFRDYMTSMKNLPYLVRCVLMNSKYYGVAQSRRRLIWIGVRKDINKTPIFPKPNRDTISVKRAFDRVINKTFMKSSKYEQKDWLLAKQGESVGKFKCVRKLRYNYPSDTLRATNPPYHPLENRRITIEEGKRLQSFPDDFKFKGSFNMQWRQIGNSVPPLLMKEIANTIKEEILN